MANSVWETAEDVVISPSGVWTVIITYVASFFFLPLFHSSYRTMANEHLTADCIFCKIIRYVYFQQCSWQRWQWLTLSLFRGEIPSLKVAETEKR